MFETDQHREDPEDLDVMALAEAIHKHIQQVQRRMLAKRRQYGKAAKKAQREQRNATRLES